MGVLNSNLSDLNVRLCDTQVMVVCSVYTPIMYVSWLFGRWPDWATNVRYHNEITGEDISRASIYCKYSKMIEKWLTDQVKALPIESIDEEIGKLVYNLFTDVVVEKNKPDDNDCYIIKSDGQHIAAINIIYMGR